MYASPVIAVAAALLSAAPHVQTAVTPPRYGLDASREHSPGGIPLIAYSAEGNGRWITEFYVMSGLNGGSDPVVFARRALDSYEAQEQVQWADSRTCHGLIPHLLRGNDIALPSLVIPLDEASRAERATLGPPAPPMPDGPGPYVFWAMAAGPVGHEVRFSTYGGPWHQWANQMSGELRSCWSSERPTYTRDA